MIVVYRARTKLVMLKLHLHSWWLNFKWRFGHWIFQWKQDKEGDVAFVVCNLLVFLKYKESTLISLDGYKLAKAGKWQGYVQPERMRIHASWCAAFLSDSAECKCNKPGAHTASD